MDPKELKGLMEAYQQIHAPQEEIEEAEKWIQKAIKKPGALHKQLGVPEGEKIPAGKLAAAAKKGGKLGQRARLAQTLKGLKEEEVQVDEAVKGEPSERRASLAAERRAGHRPLPAKEGEKYAKYKMAQMDYAKRKRMGEEVEQVDENRRAARDPEGRNSGYSKQPDPSKPGFTGIGNMSIDQIAKMSARIEKEKNKQNEEFDIFDIVIEFLQAEGYAETLEEAQWLMANKLDAEDIDTILGEAYVDYRAGKLSGGRSPQQALKGKQELNKARAATRANYDLSKPENPDAAKFKARAAKAGKVGAEMDAHTSTAGKIGKALTPGLGNRPGASPRVAHGEPNTDRHQLARQARGQSSTKG